MHAFIVRPFGLKAINKKDKASGTIQEIMFDFDKVERELIIPALAENLLEGRTTGAVFEAGSIHEDMFSLLLRDDMVIADISVHNANVFYELGIRHALRNKMTVLIKCPSFDETPFDILGYRYVSYDKDNPAAALPALVQAVKETLESNRSDSPVFKMLPKLEAQNPEHFLAAPEDFQYEVKLAGSNKDTGKLALLSFEVAQFDWAMVALRLIGEEQYRLRDFENARITWEKIRNKYPTECDANDRLATIYQRLAEKEMVENQKSASALFAKSDEAIRILLDNYEFLSLNKRAETHALKARNIKTNWIESWKKSAEADRQRKAFESNALLESYAEYKLGYLEDLNHFYSGLNALSLLTIILALADKLPDEWELKYDTKEESVRQLDNLRTSYQKLVVAVSSSIEAERNRLKGKTDCWLDMTEADYKFLTLTDSRRVFHNYKKVIESSNNLNFDSARRQLVLFQQLGALSDNANAALGAFSEHTKFDEASQRHCVLFTGHMIDKKEGRDPRFPAEKAGAVKSAIKALVEQEKNKHGEGTEGIAGGASGGDILFHEVCLELEIPTELDLTLPREEFLKESVDFAGNDWVERFDRLYDKLPRKILSETTELATWLKKKTGYNIWERSNLRMLHNALAFGACNMTLIALWNGKEGDDSGGTARMVKEAKARGVTTFVVDINSL